MKKIALVTGANRGIGLEACRQMAQAGFQVILSSRDAEKGKRAVEQLLVEPGITDVSYLCMDVADPVSVKEAVAYVEEQFGRLDVLVNNAGIYLDEGIGIMDIADGVMEETFQINYFGPYYMMKQFIPLMERNQYGRIVNISSGYGSFQNTLSDHTGSYKLSKYSLNGLTRMMASAVDSTQIKINSMCPGWVRTDMGGPQAPKQVEEVPETIIWLATLDEEGPSGQFFRDKKEIDW